MGVLTELIIPPPLKTDWTLGEVAETEEKIRDLESKVRELQHKIYPFLSEC
jgi:ubiquinone biosynthesis protein UbiJ